MPLQVAEILKMDVKYLMLAFVPVMLSNFTPVTALRCAKSPLSLALGRNNATSRCFSTTETLLTIPGPLGDCATSNHLQDCESS